MNSDKRIRRIVIAGGGTAGWMAAAAIARTLGDVVELTLVESDAIGTIGVGESTIPPLVTYNRLLGINEAEFMRATQATFKLGILFDGWKEPGHRYFHSFGLTGKDHWAAGFQHSMAEADGTRRLEGRIAQVELHHETGNIAALQLDDGTRVEGDLFLDC